MTEATFQQLEELLTPCGQQHVLSGWTALGPVEQDQLSSQIHELDLELYASLLVEREGREPVFQASDVAPASAIRLDCSLPHALEKWGKHEAQSAGEAALADGRVGMVLVAGGKGTRLGWNSPKGMLPIGPVSQRSLLQMAVDQLIAIERRHGSSIPLLVMTSPAVHDQIAAFFHEHNHFGLKPSQCRLFCQGVLPALDAESGNLLLTAPGQLLTAPDGHGGVLSALQRDGQLQRLTAEGIDTLFYAQVDNPLIQVCQAELIGYHLAAESEMTTQVVNKAHARERAGTLVLQDGAPRVVEYSELPEDLALASEPDGSLRYWAGNIAVHVLNLDFLRRASDQPGWLPLHRAHKKATCLTPGSEDAGPRERDVIQFERFVFDLLPHARNPLLVEVERKAAFAPVKNPDSQSEDTPASAQAAISALHRSWLVEAGVRVGDNLDIEIHPAWAHNAEDVRRREDLPHSIDESTFLRDEPALRDKRP